MAQIGSLSVKLGLVTVEWDKATDKAKTQAKTLQKTFDDLGKGVKDLGAKFKDMGTVAAGAALGALYANAVNLSDEVSDLSKSFGLSVPQILAFRSALQNAGGKSEDAGKAINTLFDNINDARKGNDKAIAQFEQLGISFADIKNATPYEAIQKVARGFSNISDQFEKTKKIKDFFGRAGIGISMDDLADGLAKGTAAFDPYAKSIMKVGEISDRVKENISNLTVAFTKVIEPLVGGKVIEIEKFERILKGLGAGALIVGVGLLAAKILEVSIAIRAAAAAGALFNLTAGGFTPTGLLLKAASLMAGVVAFAYIASTGSAGPDTGGKGRDTGIKPITDENGKPVYTNETVATSKEVSAKQAQVSLARQMLAFDQQRAVINRDIEHSGSVQNQVALIKIDRDEKIAQINSKLAQDMEAMKDTASEEMKSQTQGLAGVERARVVQAAKNAEALVNSKSRLEMQKEELELQNEITQAQIDRRSELKGFADEIGDAARMVEISNQRLQLENSLALATQLERDAALERFDLEVKIAEFRDRSLKLGIPSQDIDAYIERLRKATKETITIKKKTEETQNTFEFGWQRAFNEYLKNATDAAKKGGDAFNMFASGVDRAIDDLVENGKLSFSDLTMSILKDLAKIELKAQAMKLLGGSSGGGGIFDMIGSFFGGSSGGTGSSGFSEFNGYANGGDPPVGVPSMVGERGPEIFVPKTAGTIIPNHALGGMGSTTNVTNNYINAIDTKSFEDRLMGSPNAIWAANAYANKSLAVGRGRS